MAGLTGRMPVLPGLDALRAGLEPEVLAALRDRRLGLLTNPTGAAIDGTPALDVLRELDLHVVALFSPEHGPKADREGDIESGRTEDGLPVHSLYGATRRPTAEMLSGIGVLVCDLQDVGARFYTYASTIALCLEEAAKCGVTVLILDRPNPIGGEVIDGPLVEPECRSFISYLDEPVRHGMTMGELARLFVADAKLDVDLMVARAHGWRRDMLWPETGLPWRRPSPNLPDYESAAWYPGLCLLEFSGVSVGRGTEAPFQILAAPWLDPEKLMAALPARPEIADIRAEAVEVTPTHAVFEGEKCRGVRFRTASGVPQRPVVFGLAVMQALKATHAELTDELWGKANILVGSYAVLDALAAGEIDDVLGKLELSNAAFRARREPYLLY